MGSSASKMPQAIGQLTKRKTRCIRIVRLLEWIDKSHIMIRLASGFAGKALKKIFEYRINPAGGAHQ